MTIQRYAEVSWSGSADTGSGQVTLQSALLNQAPLTFASRFGESAGTNPEELVAAALASCFSTVLVMLLEEEKVTNIEMTISSTVTLSQRDSEITEANLKLYAVIPIIEKDRFDELVKDAGQMCPMIKLFNTKITLDYQLEEA